MSALRPLPAQPNLEFERKEAKTLLRRLRAGDAGALERAQARHPVLATAAAASIRLADAQLVIAREYGFTSWPRLVHYFDYVERQRNSVRTIQSSRLTFYERSARSLLVEHREHRVMAGRALAAYVPRFYGMSVGDVFKSAITEDDARLVVARQYGFPSWDVMLERVTSAPSRESDPWQVDSMQRAGAAIRAADLAGLKRVVESHPELLQPSDYDVADGRTLLHFALMHERTAGLEVMRPIMDWLTSVGFDVQGELNLRLCGHIGMKTDMVRWLLDRGADPNWIAPNGVPVLEHALIRYWNGEAVDLLASRALPRKALWIAAGLGDVDGVRRFLDPAGKPTPAARRLRPDFDAVGPAHIPSLPEPADEEILMEAFLVAMLNGRASVLEYMVSRGFPVNSLVYGSPVIDIAVGNDMTPMVACLIRCGADVDLMGYRPQSSARQLAREMFVESQNAERRRIVELCGMDPAAILAERDAVPVQPPAVEPALRTALELAADDAFRDGRSHIAPENLLFGLLRSGGLPLMFVTRVSRMDLERFHAEVKERVRPADDRVDRPELPLDSAAQAAMEKAIACATERRREMVRGTHLLYALLQDEAGVVVDLLARYGSEIVRLREELERAL